MEITTKKFARFLLVLGLVVFLSVAFLATSQVMGMEKRSDGAMSGCLFDGRAEICTMSFSQHLSSWQGMFTTALPALIAALFTAVALLRQHVLSLLSYYANRWRFYIKQNPLIAIFNPLQEAFAQGILNPKIY